MGIEYAFVDTCVMADIIRQYNPKEPHCPLKGGRYLRKGMLKILNCIISDESECGGYVVVSIFSFVELINKLSGTFGDTIKMERIIS